MHDLSMGSIPCRVVSSLERLKPRNCIFLLAHDLIVGRKVCALGLNLERREALVERVRAVCLHYLFPFSDDTIVP